ncbi:hypothetical protein H4R19_000923 [Coemansia spiralis]|nr:hypothetical protein H4R19_000923 [Coemansia spiralis]
MLEAADSCHSRKLEICSMNTISLDLVTYTGLTHLHFNGPTNADDVMELIRRLRHLVSLDISNLNLDVVQTDFSIPECTGHEPVAPLDTQISRLSVTFVTLDGSLELGAQILKYLLLKIPTLKSVNTQLVSVEQIQAFIDEYVQWYPHLANIKLM